MTRTTRTPEPELVDRDAAPVHTVDATALAALSRAEIDGQVATAKAYPRSMARFITESRELVSMDEATAEACIYSLPRGRDDDGNRNYITGPSVRFAEILAHSFSNSRYGGRVIAQDREWITAQGVFHDLEKNTMVTKEVRRRITDRYGKPFNADMQMVTGNAAISLALRNAILAGIPQAIWIPIYEAAQQVAVGDITTLAERRKAALGFFQRLGISEERICAKLGVEGVADIGIEELTTLTGLKTALRKGDLTPEAAFASAPADASAKVANLAERVEQARNGGAQAEASPENPTPKAAPAAPPSEPTIDVQLLRRSIFLAETLDVLKPLEAQVAQIPDEDQRAAVNELYLGRVKDLGA